MTKLTAEQVLADFESLSDRQKKIFLAWITKERSSSSNRKNGPKAKSDSIPAAHGFPTISSESSPGVRSSSDGFYQLLLDGELIDFKRGYLETHEDLWMLKALVGSEAVMQSLRRTKQLNDQFVEDLIATCEGEFFTNQQQTYLFATTNELFESKFGQLSPITPLEALEKYGLEKLEEASEKNYSRV